MGQCDSIQASSGPRALELAWHAEPARVRGEGRSRGSPEGWRAPPRRTSVAAAHRCLQTTRTAAMASALLAKPVLGLNRSAALPARRTRSLVVRAQRADKAQVGCRRNGRRVGLSWCRASTGGFPASVGSSVGPPRRKHGSRGEAGLGSPQPQAIKQRQAAGEHLPRWRRQAQPARTASSC